MHLFRRTCVPIALAAVIAGAAASQTIAAPLPDDPLPPRFDELADLLGTVDKQPGDLAAPGGSLRSTESGVTSRRFVDERERAHRSGRNDELNRAQRIRGVGTSRRHRFQEALITGTIADVLGVVRPIGPFSEDDGAIPLASPTGLSATVPSVRASAVIGDGPHGSTGTATGDFDLYAVEDAGAGRVLTVDIDARSVGSELDPVVAVIDASGRILAFNDDSPELDSFVQVELPAGGDYFVAVAAFGSLPTNPFDSSSGTGATSEGPYDVTMSFDFVEDVDVYRFDLRRGDVLGAALRGSGGVVEVLDPAGAVVMGSGRDQSVFYPDASPLKVVGDATLDHVAAVSGPHYLRVSRSLAGYELVVGVRRPGIESEPAGARQVIFVDFDGAFVDPSTFGTDSGDLSPLSAFIAGWGLGPADEDALIDSILATFAENVQQDPSERGGNEHFDVEIRNSRDHADPWGQPNVSRIVIGGTRDELDFDTVGLAPAVDPGNFDREDTGVVLLDQASAPAGSGLRTINDFAPPGTDMIGLVGRVIGFVASHEAGHNLGNWHTAPDNGVTSIMDTFDLTQLGLGPDFVFGTADDVDVDFVTDELIEGFIGAQDTLARTSFALSRSHGHRR